MLQAIDQFAKGTKAIMHQMALLRGEVNSLCKANEALSKRQRAKKARICLRGSLSIQDTKDLLDQKAVNEQVTQETRLGGGSVRGGRTKVRCCGLCGKPSHNSRTCKEAVELSDSTASNTIMVR
jgi:hypothetical protein